MLVLKAAVNSTRKEHLVNKVLECIMFRALCYLKCGLQVIWLDDIDPAGCSRPAGFNLRAVCSSGQQDGKNKFALSLLSVWLCNNVQHTLRSHLSGFLVKVKGVFKIKF